jgi:hypothetical protein
MEHNLPLSTSFEIVHRWIGTLPQRGIDSQANFRNKHEEKIWRCYHHRGRQHRRGAAIARLRPWSG